MPALLLNLYSTAFASPGTLTCGIQSLVGQRLDNPTSRRPVLRESLGVEGRERYPRTHPQSPHPSSAGGDFLFMTPVSSTIFTVGTVSLRFQTLSTEGASALLLASVGLSWRFRTSGKMWTRWPCLDAKSPLKRPSSSLFL